jgi:zinc transporter
VNGTQQVLAPMTTDPALALDADDRETLNRASNHVARYLGSLDECRTRVQMLEDQIEAQRSDTMTRSSLNLTIVATVFLPLTFITGLLGMNVGGIPDEHNPLGFWLVTACLSSFPWWLGAGCVARRTIAICLRSERKARGRAIGETHFNR